MFVKRREFEKMQWKVRDLEYDVREERGMRHRAESKLAAAQSALRAERSALRAAQSALRAATEMLIVWPPDGAEATYPGDHVVQLAGDGIDIVNGDGRIIARHTGACDYEYKRRGHND